MELLKFQDDTFLNGVDLIDLKTVQSCAIQLTFFNLIHRFCDSVGGAD